MTAETNYLNVWAEATDMVADALDGGVTFEWPGTIDVLVRPDTLLVYGSANHTINADVNWLDGNTWQPVEDNLPDCLITDVPSDETSPRVIADAIIASVRAWEETR